MKSILFFVLIFAIACNSVKKDIQPHRTVISGQIRNLDSTDNKVITVIYTDPILDARIAQRLDETGAFHTASNMCFTQNMTIYFGGKFINILVSPADSLFVDIDMNAYRNGTLEGITFSGKSSHLDFNKQFAAFYEYVCPNLNTDFDNNLPADEYLTMFKQKLDESHQGIDNYAREHNIEDELVRWVKRDLIYVYANYIQEYSADNLPQRLQVFTDTMFDIDNPENFSTMMFPYHLSNVGASIVRADSSFMAFAKAENMKGVCVRGVELLMERPATICRDYMLYSFLKRIFDENPQLRSLVTKECFTDSFFTDKLGMSQIVDQKRYATVSADGILYLNSDMQAKKIPDTDFMKYLTAKYRDKVLYIDVWATWCGPCIAEMKPSKELKKLFVDKDVVFVYLCLGSAADKWLPAIDKYEVEGEHYFFDDDATQLFLSAYKLDGYPSYLLVDKKGNIVSTQAPRPSNINKVAEAIDTALK